MDNNNWRPFGDQQRQLYQQSQRTLLPEMPSYSTAQTESRNAVDWQEEVYQKIKTIKEAYLPDLAGIYQRAAAKLQHEYSLPQQRRSDQFEKLKQFKTLLERMIQFLLVSKSNIMPALKDKVAVYERQIIDLVNIQRPRNPVQQGQLPQSQMQPIQQQSSHGMFSSRGQQSQNQPFQQQMMPLQSHHQQLGLQQQSNLLQQDVQQRLQSSRQVAGFLLPPQNAGDQQRQLYQSQRTLTEIPSSFLDSMAQTEIRNAVDWQEEVYQKIKTLKDAHLSYLTEIDQRVAATLQQQNSLPQQQRSEQFNKLKQFKTMLERMIQFLSVSKSNIMPALKDKVAFYEKQIVQIVNVYRPMKLVQQGQLPQSQMQPMQQQQSSQNGNPAINRGDWRTQHPPASRQKNVNTLLETLKKHVPYSGEEGIEELMRIAVSFEELIFNTARNQLDYFCKISLKMQSMEEGD
ncbi:hypothetical protein Bca4012_038183 [Brassica carinata]